jgi:putative copper resistance protein D
VHAAIVICLWFNFVSSMALFGGTAFRLALPDGANAAAIDGKLRLILTAAAAVTLAAAVALLAVETGAMADDWAAALDPQTLDEVLLSTEFGQVWLWHLGFAALAVGIAIRLGPRPALAIVAAALLGTLALIGHAAMNQGMAGLLQRANQTIHLLAGGAWIGGLIPLALLVARPASAVDQTDAALRRFTPYGMSAAILILVSGSLNTTRLVHPLSGLLTTPYGRTLMVKLVLVAVMILLALVNRVILVPALTARSQAATHRLRLSLAIEIAASALIIAAASLLGTLAPAITG